MSDPKIPYPDIVAIFCYPYNSYQLLQSLVRVRYAMKEEENAIQYLYNLFKVKLHSMSIEEGEDILK